MFYGEAGGTGDKGVAKCFVRRMHVTSGQWRDAYGLF
jgi:hypothetical protein